ncbi:MAG: Stk1 family PASTA domain-containing Ser/Thr kinase [Solobacterium sp.]|jgi:serine/threonine-protein kinase|nr:Stk1 family PASTA domain-containing Ser/Thr kinase [Solobacterium sp.]MCH4205267.1 Stk1 family PASTA domain-containing Ser/Thr kinase [Solobacterium sp.]MCH4226860.1 Stk1 family PASTA domain-containing Ser/Thr kinase [Solobacterium sp.]MCH4281620.1 Stk1 family PASTA domain-containing Ser/Thr kinase [Solobacterium sp.]
MTSKKNIIANRYEVLSHLGKGGMADVFLGIDTILNRQVAIKVLRTEMNTDAVSILRFEREAQAAAALAHPNIVEIYDVGDYKGHHYIVMEYVVGQTLKQVIKSRGPLLNEEAVDIMKQMCSAIAEAHSRGIIHRDIKPQNVIVKADGSIKILDFGIATAKGAMQLTQANNVMGSVHYLAPELARGEPSSPQSDIYALGICLYEMLAGDVPFKAEQAVQVALKHMRDPMPDIRAVNNTVPQSIENIITRATAKLPAQRYRSCDEMLRDISTCLRPDRRNEKKLILKMPEQQKRQTLEGMELQPADTDHEMTAKNQTDDLEKQKKNKRTMKILVTILCAVAAVAIFFTMVLSGVVTLGPRTVKVPDLSGMTIAEAQDTLDKDTLVLNTENITYTLTKDTKKGQIIASDPAADTEIDKKSEVSVTVSSGIGAEVQDYTGKNIDDVKDSLSAKYPYLKITVQEEASDKKAGTIIRQEGLTAGTLFDPDVVTQITLVCSAYPSVTIPTDIIGKTVAEATAELEAMGVTARSSNRDISNMSQEERDKLKIGVVIECSPAAGTSYTQKGSNYVTLYYY